MSFGIIPYGFRGIQDVMIPMAYNPTAFHNCPNCGAPVRGSSCPYCRTAFVRRPDAPKLRDLNPDDYDCPRCGSMVVESEMRNGAGRTIVRHLLCPGCGWDNTDLRRPPRGPQAVLRR